MGVPIVIFSSSCSDTEIKRALDLGGREFVRKPIELQPFTDAVHKMIDSWTETAKSCSTV
jgi:CheY-like chemotaxis protein